MPTEKQIEEAILAAHIEGAKDDPETSRWPIDYDPVEQEQARRYMRASLEAVNSLTANCAHCGRIVDTREEKDGGDKWGCQLVDGSWSCSPECYDILCGEDPKLTAEERIENALIAASETQPSWKHRCNAIMSALGFDFGDPDFEMPEEANKKDLEIETLRHDIKRNKEIVDLATKLIENGNEWKDYATKIEADQGSAIGEENLRLRTQDVERRHLLDASRTLLKMWEARGCPDCGGDCSSANPPVSLCLMRETRDTLVSIAEELGVSSK